MLNYYSATKEKGKEKFWPADIHLIGKDILWFHTVYWPAMLKSAGIKMPKKVFAHGWWTVLNQKMGKSAGNAIKVDQLISYCGVDAVRYFLFREAPFGDDGNFSEQVFQERYNNELANKLGNLISRVSTLAEKYGLEKTKIKNLNSKETINLVGKHFDKLELDKALNEIFAFIDRINEFIQKNKPWETQDKKVLFEASNAIKDAAILIYPFIPETSEKIARTFNFDISLKSLKEELKIAKITKSSILFQKIELKEKENTNKPADNNINKSNILTINMVNGKIPFKEFQKLDLRVGKILDVKEHPEADKLYILEVEFSKSDKRTIVAGLKNYYSKKDLKGKKAIFAVNLEPAKIRGVESNGMILAAVSSDESKVIFLEPEKDIEEGSKIR